MSYEALFTPLKIGGVTIKNRIILCAMGGTSPVGFNGSFNERIRLYYLARAKANVGLMIPGVTHVSTGPDRWLYQNEELFMGPIKSLMEEIHAYGSKFFLQLGAGFGRSAMPPPPGVELPEEIRNQAMLAPSDGLPNVWNPSIKHRGLTREEIHDIVDAFGKSAALCKRVGIDGVEIHAVHEGYLLDQFAMANMNHRTDEYGGSLENRLRFATEIIRSIKAACGPDYPVSVRYSAASKIRGGFNQGAIPGENYEEFGRSLEESPAAARILESAGADLLNADNGSYDSWYWAHPPVYMPMACNLPEVSYIKNFVRIPVACAGRMHDPAVDAKAIEDGVIDAVGVARQLLCDPEWCDKIREGREEDVRPCIACHNGCFAVNPNAPGRGGRMGECALNPVTQHEAEMALIPAETPKNVAVIGGGVAGMETARLLKLRGHKVTLYEKSGELGGVFIAAAAPSFKEQDKKLLDWYRLQLRKLEVDVRLNTPVSPDGLDALGADEVIVATGASPRKLPIPGFDGPMAIEAIDYLRGRKETGDRVVVIGGGLTGCEIAYDLALKGKKPVIVEMQDDILKVPGLSAANSNMLRELIRYYGVEVRLNSSLKAITEKGVTLSEAGGDVSLEADSVILSVGYVPDKTFDAPDPRVRVIGDAEKVGNLMSVIRAAYAAAYAI